MKHDTPNLWDVAKAVLRGGITASDAQIRIELKGLIYLSFYLNNLGGKTSKLNPQQTNKRQDKDQS